MSSVQAVYNSDKDVWTSNVNDALPRGSRTIISAPPNGGKTTLLLNMLCAADFDKIILINDPRSNEYNILDCERHPEMIDPASIDLGIKTILILEDLDKMSKVATEYLDHCLRIYCSHFGLTVVLLCQNYFTIPVSLRRKICTTIIMTNSINISLVLQHQGVTHRQKEQIMHLISAKKPYSYLTISSRGFFLDDKALCIN